MKDVTLSVSGALELINETLSEAYPFILIEGEVASFKVNQGKFVFFDLKDESSTLGCFMMLFKMNFPLEDGMKVRIIAQPKLTNWGRFSLTVQEVMPVGEGSLQKSFELLKAKLSKEGLFEQSRKRPLPAYPNRIGVVSSAQAAGYQDFLKILQNRWGGLEIVLAHVTVQGLSAPEQIVAALHQLNEQENPLDVIAVIRGGGSADDLAAFNHEAVVRAVAQSRTPIIAGIGHEVDTSLVDLSADTRAATPSNAAEILVPDKNTVISVAHATIQQTGQELTELIEERLQSSQDLKDAVAGKIREHIEERQVATLSLKRVITQLSPDLMLRRGYALVRAGNDLITSVHDVTIKQSLELQMHDGLIEMEVINVRH